MDRLSSKADQAVRLLAAMHREGLVILVDEAGHARVYGPREAVPDPEVMQRVHQSMDSLHAIAEAEQHVHRVIEEA